MCSCATLVACTCAVQWSSCPLIPGAQVHARALRWCVDVTQAAGDDNSEERALLLRRIQDPEWRLDRGAGYYAHERDKYNRPCLVQAGRWAAARSASSPMPATAMPQMGLLTWEHLSAIHAARQVHGGAWRCVHGCLCRHAGRSRVKVAGISQWRVWEHKLKRGERSITVQQASTHREAWN